MMIGSMNNLMNTISFSNAGSIDSVIRKGFDQARNTPRSNALLRKSRANHTRRNLVLIMDYHPNLKDLPKLINPIRPGLFSRSPGPGGGLRGPDGKNQG